MISVIMGRPVPVELTPIEQPEIGLAIVNFRPKKGWKGEFGFDWLRIADDSYHGTSRIDNYQQILQSGYKTKVASGKPVEAKESPDTNTDENTRPAVNMQKTVALDELAKAHKKTKIERPTPVTGFRVENYYLSYLNLYSQEGVEAIKKANGIRKIPTGGIIKNTVLPACQADLRAAIEVIEDIDKIELEYDKKWFTIDKTVLIQNGASAGSKLDIEIKITCRQEASESQQANGASIVSTSQSSITEDGFSTEKEIIAWAYPKDSGSKPAAEQKQLRRLAGKIIVLPNNCERRKHIDIVYVNVRLNIDSGESSTSRLLLSTNIKNHIQHSLHQSLIDCTIVEGPDLDMSKDSKFKPDVKVAATKSSVEKPTNTFVYPNGEIYCALDTKTTNKALYDYLEKEYMKQNPDYTGYFFLFYMDAEGSLPINKTDTFILFGQGKEVGFHSVILFKNYQTPNNIANHCVATHEILHGLGLHHSFPNASLDKVPLYPVQKFVFIQSKPKVDDSSGDTIPDQIATDNIMDYPPSPQVCTWHWQWKIVNGKK